MRVEVERKVEEVVVIHLSKDDLYDMLISHSKVPISSNPGGSMVETMEVTHTCEEGQFLDNGTDELVVTITRTKVQQ